MGDRLYSASAVRLASITGDITDELASNQSCDFEVFFPELARAVWWIVSRRASQFSVAVSRGCESSYTFTNATANSYTRSGWAILLTSMLGVPGFLARWNILGCSMILQYIREWSVSQSTLWYERVWGTFLMATQLTRIRSSWCQCFERECLQETLVLRLSLEKGVGDAQVMEGTEP